MLRSRFKKIVSKNEKIYSSLKILNFKISSFLSLFINDKTFLKVQYFLRLGKLLNLEKPLLFNEKVQWLKLYYRDPMLNICVDKWEVRKYVASKGLSEILIPAYGPYSSVYDIDTDKLPDQFIVKLTNGSGFNEICFDKQKFSINDIEKNFNNWQKINFYHARREWAYKDVPNRIMCEMLLHDETLSLPPDVRFFCFNGKVKLVAIDLESVKAGKKTSNYFRHLFTPQWEKIDANIQYPRKQDFSPEKPRNFTKMLEIAETLSYDFPFVRVDLYNDNGKIFFGELTFYHASGYQKITPENFEYKMGEWLDLSVIKQGL